MALTLLDNKKNTMLIRGHFLIGVAIGVSFAVLGHECDRGKSHIVEFEY